MVLQILSKGSKNGNSIFISLISKHLFGFVPMGWIDVWMDLKGLG